MRRTENIAGFCYFRRLFGREGVLGVGVDGRTYSEVKRLCYLGLDGPTLLREVAERLKRAVAFETYCASTLDPASGLITHATAVEPWGEQEAATFLDRLYFEHDLDQIT